MSHPIQSYSDDSNATEAARLARRIQHTIISNVLTESLWRRHVDECLKYKFHAAMVPAAWVRRTAQALHETGIRTASFIDFPYGTMTSEGKALEARQLAVAGAQEIDLMPNVGFLISGMEQEYFADLRGVVEAADAIPVKVMLELPLLSPEQRERAVALSVEAGVAYLKNASGGAVGTATRERRDQSRGENARADQQGDDETLALHWASSPTRSQCIVGRARYRRPSR